ncbi:diadenylate cyclase CdaA [Bernardetia sp.]|uniref:diadenylate cyclase CdaA n=1 Tax=Bernardetia sp. TaxID=1937974 RepID=UPI0025BAAFF8|nr:diadenylate cyclase CdaA [Bernardetia sp.]
MEVKWVDIFDILLVGILIYNFYQLVKGTVALRVFIGFLSLYFLYLIVQATEMELLSSILGQFMGVGVVAAVVLFQDELRRFLLLIGKAPTFNSEFWNKIFGKDDINIRWNIDAIVDSTKDMARTSTGALIVISRFDDMDKYAQTGDIIDAKISKRIISSIFFKNSPLHDGAAIFYKGRIMAARCRLPLSTNEQIPASLGMRHRAAIGMSEGTSTLILVVSEETGQISIVKNGKISKNLSPQQTRQMLNEYLSAEKKEIDDVALPS